MVDIENGGSTRSTGVVTAIVFKGIVEKTGKGGVSVYINDRAIDDAAFHFTRYCRCGEKYRKEGKLR
ncbi:hypothetical protein [Vibrio vulnificus]|uniref:hypothetical protein n=1 Tax=Vibrio vulnificus TaxID=672 RepID=UPI0020C875D7|nr:hypothetical protein [Vibrio vulnificus]